MSRNLGVEPPTADRPGSATARNPRGALGALAERARSLLETDVAWVAVLDGEDGLRVASTAGTTTAALDSMSVGPGEGIAGWAIRGGGVVRVEDRAELAGALPVGVRSALAAEGVVSILCAPMLVAGRAVGALYIGSREQTRFGSGSEALLARLAADGAVLAGRSAIAPAELAERNRLLEQTLLVQRTITARILAGAGIVSAVGELSALCGCPVVLEESATGETVCSCCTSEYCERLGEAEVVVPVTAGAASLGLLGAIRPVDSEGCRRILEVAAPVIALELVNRQAEEAVEWRLRGELLDELLDSPESQAANVTRRAKRLGVDLWIPRTAVVLGPLGDDAAARLLDVIRRGCGRSWTGEELLVSHRGDRVVLALASPTHEEALTELHRIHVKLAKAGFSLSMGAGDRTDDPRCSVRQADAAYALACAGDTPGGFVDYRGLGPLRFLLDAARTTEAAQLVVERLGALADHDRRKRSQLLETLEAYLSAGGHHPATAKACHIHVSTLKYRLAKIAEITGTCLNDPRVRFESTLAFELHRVLVATGRDPLVTEA